MNRQQILDCENFQSTLESIGKIFNIKKIEIIDFLKNIDLDRIYEEEDIDLLGHEYLLEVFTLKFGSFEDEIIAYWFHNTRCKLNTDFNNGILPLDLALPKVEDLINSIVADLGISRNNDDVKNSHRIANKLKNKSDPGPWGTLIKELTFDVPKMIHDYLEFPESIEDIVRYKYKTESNIILEEFKKRTVPCIVKFKTKKVFHPSKLANVICYLYYKINKLKFSSYCNCNITNSGKRILFEDIIKVEYFKNEK